MHIYAFGSLCRGEVDQYSDIDLLALVDSYDQRFDAGKFSVYSYTGMSELWRDGNPFAWHLFFEACLLYSHDSEDYLLQLGSPAIYVNCLNDCNKFLELFREARGSLLTGTHCLVFDLGTVFLSIRNFATCYSLLYSAAPTFSRRSALELGDDSLQISPKVFSLLERARILSTRGIGEDITRQDASDVFEHLKHIEEWMVTLQAKVKSK